MTSLTEIFDCAISEQHTDENLITLVDYILSRVHSTTRDQFHMERIGSSNAADVAFANESICDDYFESHEVPTSLVLRHLPIKELAYHLTFSEPDKATTLLNELLYYRTNSGRI